jgi:hypothetical protein
LRHSLSLVKGRRPSRPSVLVVCVMVLAVGLLILGCGSSSTTTTTTSGAVTPSTGPVSTTAPGSGGSAAAGLVGTTIPVSTGSPPDFQEALRQGKPIAVLFYTPGGVDDDSVRTSFDALSNTNSNVTFFSYDYRNPSLYGNLGVLLNVGYTPQGIFINGSNVVKNVSSGYVDESVLQQYLANIVQP